MRTNGRDEYFRSENGVSAESRWGRREYGTNTRPGKKTGGDKAKKEDRKRQGQEHGEERIRREYGGNTEGVRREYGGSTKGIRREYGRNTERIRREYGRNTRKEDRRIQPGKKTGGDKARKEYGEQTIWNINHWYFSKNMVQRSAKLPSRTSSQFELLILTCLWLILASVTLILVPWCG